MPSTTNSVTLEGIAFEQRTRIGWLLYLRSQPGFPRPMKRKGRQTLFDREDVERFFRQQRHWVARC
jgi:hypothetical protein